jgi:hypothetical protein
VLIFKLLTVSVFFFFLPGRAYLYFRKIDLSIIETLTLSLCLGIVFVGWLQLLIFKLVGREWLTLLGVGIVDIIFILSRLKEPKGITAFLRPKWTKYNFLFAVFFGLGIFLLFNSSYGYYFSPLLALASFILVRNLFGEFVAALIIFIVWFLPFLPLIPPSEFIFLNLPILLTGLFCFRKRLYLPATFLSATALIFYFFSLNLWPGFLF